MNVEPKTAGNCSSKTRIRSRPSPDPSLQGCLRDSRAMSTRSSDLPYPKCVFALSIRAAMQTKLSDLEIRRALGTLPGWARKGEALNKTYSFAHFADGIRFVQQIAELADAMNHHPDIDIRYTDVSFSLSSHDAGGITQRDLDLAKEIEQAAGFDQKPGA